ncbi:post-transcriptional regulator [Alkalihalophilus lindianensis]|uniref:Post-transcriptional regulator n=1 Tax=Alkalihalophilus lindianensis TaxID=1630542 RepID=A0ABU3XDF2_9BACI|nr:post-transcriptional regulator [Alkalihalophilus lindianensis]MDV2685916.1 post-transcriptional regulator [Alkalihalophilus lindianensis]
MERQQFESWRYDVEPALASKVEEFHFLGYDRVTVDQVWACVMDRLRKQKEFIHLHAFVQVILTLKVQDYMTWVTKESYREGENWFKKQESFG